MEGSVESRDVPACVIDLEAGGAFSALSASVNSEESSRKGPLYSALQCFASKIAIFVLGNASISLELLYRLYA